LAAFDAAAPVAKAKLTTRSILLLDCKQAGDPQDQTSSTAESA
jgi:hypothetical protein